MARVSLQKLHFRIHTLEAHIDAVYDAVEPWEELTAEEVERIRLLEQCKQSYWEEVEEIERGMDVQYCLYGNREGASFQTAYSMLDPALRRCCRVCWKHDYGEELTLVPQDDLLNFLFLVFYLDEDYSHPGSCFQHNTSYGTSSWTSEGIQHGWYSPV